MALPPLDEEGYLPPGIHAAMLAELEEVFRYGSPRRNWLWGRLVEVMEVARASGRVKRLIIWGSFVTRKELPGDLDLLLITDAGAIQPSNIGPLMDLLDHERARHRFQADIFWMKESIGSAIIHDVLDAYQVDRTLRRRGIVEVTL